MKKIISLIVAVILAMSVCVFSYAKAVGDINGDSKVNSNDALIVLQYSVGKINDIDKKAADVTGDGKINSSDALRILQISVGVVDTSKYRATFTLSAKVDNKTYKSGDVIPVKPGSTVYVTLSLANNYYTGPTSAQLYYNNKIFSSAPKATFNTDGRLFEVCSKQSCTFKDWDKIAEDNKQKCWPNYSEAKLKEFKDNHKFLRVTMAPNAMVASEVPMAISEDLVTIEFKVSSSAKKNTTGQIIIPVESRRTRDYLNGHLICSVYESEDISSKSNAYAEGLTYDCSKAVLDFKVV